MNPAEADVEHGIERAVSDCQPVRKESGVKKSLSALAVLLASGIMAGEARSSTFSFDLGGPGVSGSFVLTYGAATDAKYPDAYEVTGISGTFSDSNNGLGIVNAAIGALVPVTHDTPEATNLLAPHDFSRFAVASGLEHGSLSFDNLYYPGGSPQTASDYPFHGGFLDIYGLLFDIGGGRVVNVWSNGVGPNGVLDYGIAVATASNALDYVADSVSPVPEPASLWMFGGGLFGVLAWRRRAAAAVSPAG